MSDKTVSAASTAPLETDHVYHEFERMIADRVAAARGPLFTTDADGLFQAYLSGIPGESHYGECNCGADRSEPSAEAHDNNCPANTLLHFGTRQHYNCRCCRRFFERFGGLVTINDAGNISPVLWRIGSDDFPDFFQKSAWDLDSIVTKSSVTGVFLSSEAVWGTPFNVPGVPSKYQGVRWTHLNGTPANVLVFRNPLKTADQVTAEKREEHGMLCRALAEWPVAAVEEAVRVLRADALSRSEKVLGVAEWFLKLHKQIAPHGNGYGGGRKAGNLRHNLIWLAVATAPSGFCHLRANVINTLLDDIVAGLGFNAVSRRWADKMHPLQYQRPTAPPSDGAIKQAEKLVEKLRSAGSLDRRFARLSEVIGYAIWTPKVETPSEPTRTGGVFDHLRQQKQPKVGQLELPPVTLTWEKFSDKVLPEVVGMELLIDSGMLPFCGVLTAANADAPPILQWDGLKDMRTSVVNAAADMSDAALESGAICEEVTVTANLPRNPVSWYFWHGGSPAHAFGLAPMSWVKVNAVLPSPAHFQRPEQFKHHAALALFVLDGCREQRECNGGLFPECLRAEYHGIRSVLEAHTKSTTVAGREDGDANGLALQSTTQARFTVRVQLSSGHQTYVLDRWE